MPDFWIVQAVVVVVLPGLLLGIFASRPLNLKLIANLFLPLSVASHFLITKFVQIWEVNVYTSRTSLQIVVFSGGLLGLVALSRKDIRRVWQIRWTSDLLIPLSCLTAGLFVAYRHLNLAGGWASLVPNNDGQNHAFLTKNLLEAGKLSVASAQRYFPNVADSAGDFYPLGVHNLVARVVASTGIGIPEATNVVLLLAVVLYFVNMGLLLGELESKKLIVATFLPIGLILASPGFPWRPLAWGGLTLIVGLSMVPGMVSAAIHVSRHRTSKLELTVMGCALFGVFICHIAEVGVIILLAPLFALGLSTGLVKRVSLNLLGSLAVLAILAMPLLPSLLRGAQERAYFMPGKVDAVQNLAAMLFYIGGYHSGIMIALSTVGFVVASRRDSPYRGIAVAVVLIAVVSFNLAKDPSGLFGDLTFPWYRQVERVNYNFYVILPVLVVSGLSAIIGKLRLAKRQRVVAAVLLVILVSSVGPALSQMRHQYHQQRDVTPADSNMRAAFKYLKANASGSIVLADISRSSGAMWMYPLEGVKPLIVDYGSENTQDPLWNDKVYLLKSVGKWAQDKRAVSILKRFGISWLLYNDRSNAVGDPRIVSKDALRRESLLTNEWNSETASIYRVQLEEEK